MRIAGLIPTLLTAAGVLAALVLVTWLLTRWVRELTGAKAAANDLQRSIWRTLEMVAAFAVGLVILRGAGIGVPRLTWREISDLAMSKGLRILFIFAGAYVLMRITDFAISHFQTILGSVEAEPLDLIERRKRIDTIGRLFRALAIVVIFGMALLMALRQVDVDITPLLTGAGVAGVALGFGAQTVVKDIIAGVFLILENQIRVGDIITINGKTGLVETIRLRIIVLRANDGTVYIFQNGAVTEYANLTKDFSYAVLDLNVAYKEDLERVTRALQEVGKSIQEDRVYGPDVLAALEILGIETLASAAVTIKVRMKTRPMQQWAVDRELRRRVKARFDQDGIALV